MIYIFLTAVEKSKTKCKDEEDHRCFAERPFSYGDFVLIHLHNHVGSNVLLLVMNLDVCKFILVARSHVCCGGKLRLCYNIGSEANPDNLFSR